MRKLLAFEWVTLDNVFDAETMPVWFDPCHSDERAEIIQDTILNASAFLYGRTTYQMLAPYWSQLTNNEFGIADKLNATPKYVVSTTLETAEWQNTTLIRTNVAKEVARLKRGSGGNIVIFGSAKLTKSLMDARLVDGLRLLVHPHLMGEGKRFFSERIAPTRLEHQSARTLPHGVTLLDYNVTYPAT
jgi:dihydrofolate reductase